MIKFKLICRLAWRNLFRRSVHALILIMGIMAGVSGIMFFSAQLQGVVRGMTRSVVDVSTGDIQIHADYYMKDRQAGIYINATDKAVDIIQSTWDVIGCTPRVILNGYAIGRRGAGFVNIYGIEPDMEKTVTVIDRCLVKGRFLSQPDNPDQKEQMDVCVGQALADKLKLEPGDKMEIMAFDRNGNMNGYAFRVVGIFKTGSNEYDKSNVYIHSNVARKILNIDMGVHEIAIRVKNPSVLDSVYQELKAKMTIGNIEIGTWKELSPVLWDSIRACKSTAFIIYSIIYLAMAFGIVNLFIMKIFSRVREFGIMMALGLCPFDVVMMILTEAFFLGFIGSISGVLSSCLIMLGLLGGSFNPAIFADRLQFLGIGTEIPLIITPGTVFFAIFATVTVVCLSALYPALRASRIKPATVVRRGV